MGVIYGTCGHDITGYFERAVAWWRTVDREGGPCWSYGSLCDACFVSYKAQRERPAEVLAGFLPYSDEELREMERLSRAEDEEDA